MEKKTQQSAEVTAMPNSLLQWKSDTDKSSLAIVGKRISGLSIEKCFDSVQVSTAIINLGQEYIHALIIKAINEAAEMLNATMSATAIVMTAETILNDYLEWRIDELLYVLYNGMKGNYGVSNKNLNAQVIFEWFDKHATDRDEMFYQRHLVLKHSSGNPGDRMSKPEVYSVGQMIKDEVDQKVQQRIKKYKEKAGIKDDGLQLSDKQIEFLKK